MNRRNQPRPQVPGDSSGCAGVDGRHTNPGVRGAKNLRARSYRQTTPAHVIKDTDTLNILTYNVRTLMEDERLIELENALQNINWDIVGLGEVRRLGEHTEERDDNIFFNFGETSGHHGVGFLVAKKWKDNIIEFKGYSERIAILRFRVTPKTTLTVVQVYAPTSAHSIEDLESFYDLVNIACEENRGTWNIVLGDFNAKLGIRQATDSDAILGQFGLGDRNERGTRLIQFALGQNMSVANSFYEKKPQRRWTWVSPGGNTRNEIDFVLTSDLHIVKDVNVINKIKYSSDHRPIRAKIKFNFKIHRNKLFRNKIRQHSKQILIQNSENFNVALSNQFSILGINEIEDVNDQYKTIIKGIELGSKTIKNTVKNKAKLSKDTRELISQREKMKIATEEYNKFDRKVKRSIRKDIRLLNLYLIQTAIEKHTSLRTAKQGIFRSKHWINCLQDPNKIKHNSRDKIMEVCTDFYKKLYSDNTKTTENVDYSKPDSIPFITGKEVHNVLKTMKYDRSPGEDGVTSEALKIGAPTLLPHITNLFNTILQTGQIPKQMCHSNIVLLHKKGDKTNIGNYRPISLISHLYKAFIKVVQNRISGILDQHQPPEQAGFRPGFSTIDHLHTLNQIIEKYTEFHKPLYIAFVDYTKAFDSLQHSAIFKSLENQQIHKTYIDLIKIIYRQSTANIKLQSTGPAFHIQKGVKQGDPLSPILFTSTLEEVFTTLSWATRGINIGGKHLTNLRFADDIVLFAQTAHDLQEMLQELSAASLEVGLQMNRSKTQIMTNATKRRVEVDGQEILYVDEYIYLGQLASFENRHDKEIDRRIENAWKSYWSMKAHMKGDLPMNLKRKLIDMCILPILTYGAQTWSLTELQKSKLKICQRAMERSVLGFRRADRVRNTTLRSLTGIADVGAKTAKLKWDWAGHVSRMLPEKWAHIVTDWVPEDGQRRRGRPRKRWRDDINGFEKEWWESAKDRDRWKELREAFAQQWENVG